MPKPITLSAGYSDGVTVIPNTFLMNICREPTENF